MKHNNMPKAFIKHQLPGRVRIKIPQKRGNEVFFEELAEVLAVCDSISQLQLNSQAASVLIVHTAPNFDEIAKFAADTGLFTLAADGDAEFQTPNLSLAGISSLGVAEVDKGMRKLTFGLVDMRTILFLGFVGLGIQEARKGHIMSPASTFWWRALELLNAKNDKMYPTRNERNPY